MRYTYILGHYDLTPNNGVKKNTYFILGNSEITNIIF